MPTTLIPRKEQAPLITDPGRRRSMRVLLSVPVVISGKDIENKEFREDSRTLVVNAHGALIALTTRLAPNQQVMISNPASQVTLLGRVIHTGTTQGGKMQLGLEFAKPAPSFWQIDFPPEDWLSIED